MRLTRKRKIIKILMYRTMTDDAKRTVNSGVESWTLSDMFYRLYRKTMQD